MTATPSDPSPSQEPAAEAGAEVPTSYEAEWAEAATTAHEIRFPVKSTVRINPLDRELEREQDADRGLEM